MSVVVTTNSHQSNVSNHKTVLKGDKNYKIKVGKKAEIFLKICTMYLKYKNKLLL